jgi:putative ABC transport system permease protein
MLRLAVSNLVQNKMRLAIAVAGVGLALTLVLFFAAVLAGAQGRLTLYIDKSGADLWVSQAGVQTMHMSESALPATITGRIAGVEGVAEAVPILYAEVTIQSAEDEYIVYVFGIAQDPPLGGPWRIVDGTPQLERGDVIIDRAIAKQAGVGVGDSITVLGREMRITGLTSGTSSIVSSATFIRFEDFAEARGGDDVVSFVLVRVAPGASVPDTMDRIASEVPDVTVQTSEQFADQERALVGDMTSDLINIMNTAGFLTGFAVLMLTIYIAAVARRREYGILKAMGVRNTRLYVLVLVQALIIAALGLLTGLGMTLALSAIIPRFNELMVLSVTASSLARTAIISVVLAAAAALLPARQLAGLEPVAVIRRSQ